MNKFLLCLTVLLYFIGFSYCFWMGLKLPLEESLSASQNGGLLPLFDICILRLNLLVLFDLTECINGGNEER